jgi:hypothetical protein
MEGLISIPVLNNQNRTWTFAFEPFAAVDIADTYDIWYGFLGSLVGSNLYNTYCRLYDQVKINSFSLQLSVLSVPAGQAVKIYTAVDREAELDELKSRPSHANIITGAETYTTQFTSLDRSTMKRYIKARDIQERTRFIDSTTNAFAQAAQGQVPAYSVAGNYDWYHNGGAGAFCPAMFGFFELSQKPAAFPANVVFSYRVRWNVTFRNPKFSIAGAQGNLAKFEKMAANVVEDIKEDAEDDEVKMKDDEKEDEMEETPVLKKKKVVYEEEVLPDVEDEEDDEESQAPLTQPFKSPMKKAGKKSST